MKRALPLLLFLSAGTTLLTAGCAEPGKEVRPMEGAFAFIEMKLGS